MSLTTPYAGPGVTSRDCHGPPILGAASAHRQRPRTAIDTYREGPCPRPATWRHRRTAAAIMPDGVTDDVKWTGHGVWSTAVNVQRFFGDLSGTGQNAGSGAGGPFRCQSPTSRSGWRRSCGLTTRDPMAPSAFCSLEHRFVRGRCRDRPARSRQTWRSRRTRRAISICRSATAAAGRCCGACRNSRSSAQPSRSRVAAASSASRPWRPDPAKCVMACTTASVRRG